MIVKLISELLLPIKHIDWISVMYLLITIWWISTIIYLNRSRNEFDITLSRIAAGFMILILIIDAFLYNLHGSIDGNVLGTTANVIFPFCGFYLLYILSRIYGLTIENHEPQGLELIMNMILFALFPIGIWKFQDKIKRAIDENNVANSAQRQGQ